MKLLRKFLNFQTLPPDMPSAGADHCPPRPRPDITLIGIDSAEGDFVPGIPHLAGKAAGKSYWVEGWLAAGLDFFAGRA
jgi:hypothetical protein